MTIEHDPIEPENSSAPPTAAFSRSSCPAASKIDDVLRRDGWWTSPSSFRNEICRLVAGAMGLVALRPPAPGRRNAILTVLSLARTRAVRRNLTFCWSLVGPVLFEVKQRFRGESEKGVGRPSRSRLQLASSQLVRGVGVLALQGSLRPHLGVEKLERIPGVIPRRRCARS